MNEVLTSAQQNVLLEKLQQRFEGNMHRHEGLSWADVKAKLEKNKHSLWALHEMEHTGGEPDVIGYDEEMAAYIFCDCAKETPTERRSVCYDQKALDERKKHKPKDSAINLADKMGIELLTEAQYRELQKLEICDTKTSSWIKTPEDIRERGGALFGDYRYGHVFIYHNSASSYYSSRGFRGLLRV